MRVPMHFSRRFFLILLLAGVALLPAALLHAQGDGSSASSANYDLSWWTVDGGGSTGPASSQSYSLLGTIGQPDAGEMEGPRYGLVGGFWAIDQAGIGYDRQIYLPLLVRNEP